MPIVEYAFMAAAALIVGAASSIGASVANRPSKSNITDEERTKRKYWYYRRKSGYRWK